MSDINKISGDKRLRIIKAATKIFSRKGFHKAKVEEIAEEAVVGKGTVYEYFASKKELFLEMILYAHQQYQDSLEQELSRAETFRDGLQKLFQVTMNFMKEHKEMALILLADHPLLGEDIHKVLCQKEQQQLESMSKMLQDVTRRGEIRPVSTHAASLVIFGALYLICGQVVFHEDNQETDFQQLSQEAINIILRGLAPPVKEML